MVCCVSGLIFYVFLYWIFRYIIGPIIWANIKFNVLTLMKRHVTVIKRSGKWAVVTGSTDGIGREYCRQLAKLGLNIFLISRDETKLESTSKELKHYYKIDVRYFKADFTSNAIYDGLNDVLKDLDIGVLVNNVGMTQPYSECFHKIDLKVSFLSNMINCNILSAVSMTKLVVPGMLQRNRGIIINISSISSIFQMPMNGFYSSTKAFLTQFSLVNNIELSNSGIIVQTVLPSYIQTKFIGKYRPPSILVHSPEDYVESAIKTVGFETYTFGTLRHTITAIVIESLPKFITAKVGNILQAARQKCQ